VKAWAAFAGSAALALGGCATSPRPAEVAAARRNAASLYTLPVNLFGRPETGWALYAPKVETTVGAADPPDRPGFARALARWRRRSGKRTDGVLDAPTLQAMKRLWQAERPFLAFRGSGACPDPPPPDALAAVEPEESYGGRPLLARTGALTAYRRMIEQARLAEPFLAARPELLQIFSAYRSPERDAARCAQEHNCQGVVRAGCSAHRTGLALDLVLEAAPGYAVDSSADVNRLAMARGLAYRWLLANAPRYGFVNYAFEPWHWEWTGAPVQAKRSSQ
jgi:zinc D-Ala-D-Ala carboxypeptidase